jgi:hypothetical protein
MRATTDRVAENTMAEQAEQFVEDLRRFVTFPDCRHCGDCRCSGGGCFGSFSFAP